jgi:Ca-activated chloride channel family protein
MLRPPPAPSPLERAQLKIADLARARAGQPLGLIAYAGSAHLVLAPTRDTAIVAQFAAEISPDLMPVAGDRLDLALREAERVLNEAGQGGSIVVLADTAHADAPLQETSVPLQLLAINAPDSPEDHALRGIARTLHASVEALRVDDDDVAAIVRRAAGAPAALAGQQSGRWEEAGYWLVPLLALLVSISFRRRAEAPL